MMTAPTLGLVATWFVFGQARLVMASKLAEHRLDDPAPSSAIVFNLAAAAAQASAAQYDPRGRRLLPWYRAVNATYWVFVVGVCVWTVVHA